MSCLAPEFFPASLDQWKSPKVHPQTDQAWSKQTRTGFVGNVERCECSLEKFLLLEQCSSPVDRHHNQNRGEEPQMSRCGNSCQPRQQVGRVEGVSNPRVRTMADKVTREIRREHGGQWFRSIGIYSPPEQDQ